MFSKREDVVSAELAVLPDEMLDKVAGGAGGKPTNFLLWTNSEGEEVFHNPKSPTPPGWTPVYYPGTTTQVTGSPGGEA